MTTLNPAISVDDIDLEAYRPRAAEGIAISRYSEGDAGRNNARYVVKDNSNSFYIMTGASGVKVLELLTGDYTVKQLQKVINEDFGFNFSKEKLLSFLTLCFNNRLIADDTWVDDGKRPDKSNKRERLGVYSSVFNADELLDAIIEYKAWWLNPLTKGLFLGFFVMGIIGLFTIPEGGGLLSPIKQMTFSYQDVFLLLLPIIYLVELSTHELAHALACRMAGARTQGFGVGLLWGCLPIFFTETTDSYVISDKYKRMFVSFAGPMVDIVFFGVAMWLFYVLEPGIASTVALAYSGISLSSFIVSLNPFVIRMDGYWILADWLEKPNLRRDAFRYLKNSVKSLFGKDVAPDLTLQQQLSDDPFIKVKYVIYSIVSFAWTGAYILVIFVELFKFVFNLMVSMHGSPSYYF
ncbi:M50 family metallopeptidase [Aestuariibacter halophilus]|uniref:M50 family metallopeptidase n=1 Tax=Fluctibacter halophilus TaxID=226011 RepID=A0ABS8G6C1_9ALTE|nr:M50 family metallopeptidase [Aestuariibacter halophilus]MCC2616142.1 M50 family metallopeptidase [Aestuariibacter halophilus]